jgi:hypothetical protein
MRFVVSFVIVCLASSTGRADPIGFVQIGAESGSGTYTNTYSGIELDGGHRLYRWLWLHGHLGFGRLGTIDLAVLGKYSVRDYQEARMGLEARTCTHSKGACFVGGLDVGIHHLDEYNYSDNILGMVHDPEHSTGVVIGRLGADFGGRNIRVRPMLEIGFGDPMTDEPTPAALLHANRFGASVGVAYQW